jgi:hypothetical protein
MKKGYIYITSTGYDSEKGKPINDPYLGDTPTLGACMPNVRRRVVPGDHIFLISGRIPQVQQFIVGGFEVAEKLHATEAYALFPKLRVHLDKNGEKIGNIIVDSNGKQNPLDTHDGFDQRVEDYIVGRNPIVLAQPSEIARGRIETMDILRKVLHKDGTAPINVVGRWSRLDEAQIEEIRRWLLAIKRAA